MAADLDAWLIAREADGTLGALRQEHVAGVLPTPIANPLDALVAALDERLARYNRDTEVSTERGPEQ